MLRLRLLIIPCLVGILALVAYGQLIRPKQIKGDGDASHVLKSKASPDSVAEWGAVPSGPATSAARADSLGPLSPAYRAYLSGSGAVNAFLDSLGIRVDTLARVKWVRGLNITNAKNADTLGHWIYVTGGDTVESKGHRMVFDRDTVIFTGGANHSILAIPYWSASCPDMSSWPNGSIMACAGGVSYKTASGQHTLSRADSTNLFERGQRFSSADGGTRLEIAWNDTLFKGGTQTGDHVQRVWALKNGLTHSDSIHSGFIWADTTNRDNENKGTGVIAGDTILGNARQNKYTFYGVAVEGDTFDSWQFPGTDTMVIYRIDAWCITPPTTEGSALGDSFVLTQGASGDSIKFRINTNTKRKVWGGTAADSTKFKCGVNTSWVCRKVGDIGAADVNITVWFYPAPHGPGGAPWLGVASVGGGYFWQILGALGVLAAAGAAYKKFRGMV